jgi:hypothetical protein
MGSLFTVQDLLNEIHAGRMQCFAENDSIAITRLARYPRCQVLEIVAAVGSIDDLRILHDRVLNYAAEVGVGVVQAYGRVGWRADAERRGWKVKAKSYVFQKDM